jgi:hypothetical protein
MEVSSASELEIEGGAGSFEHGVRTAKEDWQKDKTPMRRSSDKPVPADPQVVESPEEIQERKEFERTKRRIELAKAQLDDKRAQAEIHAIVTNSRIESALAVGLSTLSMFAGVLILMAIKPSKRG